jgi:hypothetical protein
MKRSTIGNFAALDAVNWLFQESSQCNAANSFFWRFWGEIELPDVNINAYHISEG